MPRGPVGTTAALGGCAALVGLSLLVLAGAANAQPASSRVVFDATFGNPGAADVVDLGGGNFDHRVDYCGASCGSELPGGSHGQLVGTGLFQSLQHLDLVTGDEATFAASSGDLVDNVFARVTGGETSQIWGVLNSEIPGANLWLMNADGFVFGPTSGVNVDSSFAVTSADELMFAGGQTFEAVAGGAVPTLAVDAPVSFGFWVDTAAPATIAFEETVAFGAGVGETLSVVAGRVDVSGGTLLEFPPATLLSNGGQIQLAAAPAGSGGTLQVPVDLTDPALDVADLASDSAAVVLDGNAAIAVSGGTPAAPGRIVIRGGRFETDRFGTFPRGGTLRAIQTGEAGANAIDVEVAGELLLESALVESKTTALAAGGDIRLVAGDVALTGATEILGGMEITPVLLDGPDVHVEATDPNGAVSVVGGSTILSADDQLVGLNFGKVGDVTVSGQEVLVSGAGSAVGTTTKGRGDSGTIRIAAIDRVLVEDGAQVFSNRLPDSGFNGDPSDFGSIRVDAAELVVTDTGQIVSDTSSSAYPGAAVEIGFSGPIERVEVTGGAIGSITTAAGRGGDVRVRAGDLIVQTSVAIPESNPQISALTTRRSDGSGGDGPGGDLLIEARTLTLNDGGQLRAVTEGSASGGDLTVNVDETILAAGRFILPDPGDGNPPESRPSGIFGRSQVFSGDPTAATTGGGGEVKITATDIVLRNGAEFSSSAESAGPAGNLTVTADTILVEGPSTSTIAAKGAQGPGGNLRVEARERLELRDGAIVTASTRGTGDAGNLVVVSPVVGISGEDTGIFAQSLSAQLNGAGRAGSIDISPPDGEGLELVVTDGGSVSVESRQAAAGSIAITSADRLEVSDGGEISATVGNVPFVDAGRASDITIADAGAVVVRNGTITAETLQNGRGGSISIDAATVDLSEGARITAQSQSGSVDAGDAGSISVAASRSFDATDTTITTQSDAGAGGDITIHDTDRFTLGRASTMTAETTGPGAGGEILFRDVRSVQLRGGAAVTTRSTAPMGGDAGNIVIAAIDSFEAENASITTTADDAGGGRISIQAGKLVSFLDSDVVTTVSGVDPQQGDQDDAGDIDIPLRGDEVDGLSTVVPEFVVINRSTIQANADATDAGNITIAGVDVLVSSDSLIEATSEEGVSGQIEITSPDAEIVSQVTALPSEFVDPSDRLLPACVARTERTGSFTVESRPAPPPSPDAPLAPPAAFDPAASATSPQCDAPVENL